MKLSRYMRFVMDYKKFRESIEPELEQYRLQSWDEYTLTALVKRDMMRLDNRKSRLDAGVKRINDGTIKRRKAKYER